MSISAFLVKAGMVVLFVVGLALMVGAVGLVILPVSFISPLWSVVLGIIFIAVSLWVLAGGKITL